MGAFYFLGIISKSLSLSTLSSILSKAFLPIKLPIVNGGKLFTEFLLPLRIAPTSQGSGKCPG